MMYFVKGTTCTYCKIWAGTNFEAGREMKKKLQGIQCSVCSQSTGHYMYFIFGTFGTIISLIYDAKQCFLTAIKSFPQVMDLTMEGP